VRLYNGKNLTGVANIVFSNGKLDPWSNGGVLESISDSVISVVIKDGAHHLDLRASNPADPESVIQARAIHRANILKWLERPQDSTPFHHETIL
jgi:lysosomal Pro-X carboxypeptidase